MNEYKIVYNIAIFVDNGNPRHNHQRLDIINADSARIALDQALLEAERYNEEQRAICSNSMAVQNVKSVKDIVKL